MRAVLSAVLVLALAACSESGTGPADGLRVQTDAASYGLIGNGPAEDNHGMGAGHDDHGALAATTITWKVPPRWKEMPNSSSMRLATYRVPRAEGDKAEPAGFQKEGRVIHDKFSRGRRRRSRKRNSRGLALLYLSIQVRLAWRNGSLCFPQLSAARAPVQHPG